MVRKRLLGISLPFLLSTEVILFWYLQSIKRKGRIANLFEFRLPEGLMFIHYPGVNFGESGSKVLLDSDPDFFFKPETEKI
jgi:hypothetical protein